MTRHIIKIGGDMQTSNRLCKRRLFTELSPQKIITTLLSWEVTLRRMYQMAIQFMYPSLNTRFKNYELILRFTKILSCLAYTYIPYCFRIFYREICLELIFKKYGSISLLYSCVN
jgi:hypothetical protein